MLKKHSNELLELIPHLDLDRKDFKGERTIEDSLSGLIVDSLKTNLRFTVFNVEGDVHTFFVRYGKYGGGTLPADSNAQVNLKELKVLFSTWLIREVKVALEDADTPDLWAELADTIETESVVFDATPFEAEEKTEIIAAIGRFKVSLTDTFNPTEEQLHSIDNRLEYLCEAVDRLNRFDWKGVAFQTLISICTALALEPDKRQILVQLFQQSMRALHHFLQ